jgi:hypothetical protein
MGEERAFRERATRKDVAAMSEVSEEAHTLTLCFLETAIISSKCSSAGVGSRGSAAKGLLSILHKVSQGGV